MGDWIQPQFAPALTDSLGAHHCSSLSARVWRRKRSLLQECLQGDLGLPVRATSKEKVPGLFLSTARAAPNLATAFATHNFGNFGNFGAGSFSKQPTPEVSRVKPILSEFGGSAPDSLYSSNRESSWTRWRKGWELAVADGARKSFNYPFTYAIPFPPGIITPIGGRQPVLSGVFQGFPTQNKELGMHWAGKVEAGNLRFDNLRSEDGQRLAISGEVDPTVMFLGSGQDNTNFWYVQVSGTYSANRISGVTGPLPPPLFVSFGPAGSLKAINGDVLQDTILTVSGDSKKFDKILPLRAHMEQLH